MLSNSIKNEVLDRKKYVMNDRATPEILESYYTTIGDYDFLNNIILIHPDLKKYPKLLDFVLIHEFNHYLYDMSSSNILISTWRHIKLDFKDRYQQSEDISKVLKIFYKNKRKVKLRRIPRVYLSNFLYAFGSIGVDFCGSIYEVYRRMRMSLIR